MRASRHQGMTLIELVLTLVVVAVLSVGLGHYLRYGIDGYSLTKDRIEYQGQGRFVIERLSRELRHAVPNSLEITHHGQCLSYTPIAFSGRYFSSSSSSSVPDENLTAMNSIKTLTLLLAQKVELNSTSSVKYRVTIQPMTAADLLPNVLESEDRVYSAPVKTVRQNDQWLTVEFPNEVRFFAGSSGQRIYGYQQKVTWCFEKDQLIRSQEVGWQTKSLQHVVMADRIVPLSGKFVGQGAAFNPYGVINVVFDIGTEEESSLYRHDIQVLNGA